MSEPKQKTESTVNNSTSDKTDKTNTEQQGKAAHEMTFIEKVAQASGTSREYVRRILSGERTPETKKGERVYAAAELLKTKENLLLQEVASIVKV